MFGGLGRGRGRGLGRGRGGGRGMGQSGMGYGPEGYCVCPKCGYRTPHQQGVSCPSMTCPKCGTKLVREELIKDRKKAAEEKKKSKG